jgi:hypothetical protein
MVLFLKEKNKENETIHVFFTKSEDKWKRIKLNKKNHIIQLLPYFSKSNTQGATRGVGTVYPSGVP